MKTFVTFERQSFLREETENISCKRKQLINWTSKLKLMLFERHHLESEKWSHKVKKIIKELVPGT